MNKRINLLKATLLFLALVALSSCSSDDDGNPSETSTGNYFPMAVGNKWNYTNGTNASHVELTGTVNYPDGVYYTLVDSENVLGNQSSVMKNGASYFQKTGATTITESGATITVPSFAMVIFKDNLEVDQGWMSTQTLNVTYTSPLGSGTLPATLDYDSLITARNVTETLGDITYNNIIKVETELIQTINSEVITIHSEHWFAKDIGPVFESITSSTDNVTRTRYLTSYELH